MIISRKLKDNKGVSGIEYGLIAGFLSVVIMSSVAMTGTDTKQTFCAVEKGLTGTYSGDCAQARVAELRSMISMFSLKISAANSDEAIALGITDEPGSEEYEQDKANAIAGIESSIDQENQMIDDLEQSMSNSQADLAKLQAIQDNLNNGTYTTDPTTGAILNQNGVTVSPNQSSLTNLINRDNKYISQDQNGIATEQKLIASDQATLDKFNNDEVTITHYTDAITGASQEIDSYK